MRKPNSTAPYNNFWESTKGAAGGFFYALRHEKKVRQVFISLMATMAICIIADVGYFQILMVIFSWVVCLICEIFNTALEKVLDYAAGKEFHLLVKQGKDYASACTFVAIVFAVSLTLFVLWGRYFGDNPPHAPTFQTASSIQSIPD